MMSMMLLMMMTTTKASIRMFRLMFWLLLCYCSNGDGRTGVFLSLCLSIERLDTEDTVDIFQTVRWLRSQRAGLVSNVVSRLGLKM